MKFLPAEVVVEMATAAHPRPTEKSPADSRPHADFRATRCDPVVSRAADEERATRRLRAESLDAMSTTWRAALDTAQRALHAAGPMLPAQKLREQNMQLRSERADTAQLLEALARDWQLSAWFSDLQVPAWNVQRLLGLTPGITACVFNLDGVLIGSAAVHAAAWGETFNAFISARVDRTGGRFDAFDPRADYYAHLHGKPRLDGVRAFLASRGIRLPEGEPRDPAGSETVHGLANRKKDVLLRRLEAGRLSAFAGSRRYLQLARDAGIRCAVVSASANTQTILDGAELTALIDACVDGNTMAAERLRAQPAPDTLLAACRRLAVEPEHAAAFETNARGIAAARTAGFALVVGIGETFPVQALEGQGADVVASGLSELLERQLATSRWAFDTSSSNRRIG